MCRLVAYHGPPLPLSAALSDVPHGLVRQAYAAREMTRGVLNADGWGVGWYRPGASGTRPGVLKGVLPIWGDANALAATHAIVSGSFLAVVRGASEGLGVAMANTPPYVSRADLFAHNGRLWPWNTSLRRALRERIDPEDEAEIRGTTDSEWLLALWRTRLRRSPERGECGSLRETLREVGELAAGLGGGVTANVVLQGPKGFLAARFATQGPAPSLYVGRGHPGWPGGVVVASEPIDEGGPWELVPPSSLVRVDGDAASIEPLWGQQAGVD